MDISTSRIPLPGAELISVRIGDQAYAIDIMAVREIRGWTAATPLPHAPPHVLGMMNLRGAIQPVIDLGARLGLGMAEPGPSSVVVVAQIGDAQMGLVVDAVSDILTVTEGLIQPPPSVGSIESTTYVAGVMTTDTGIVSLLSLDHILPAEVQATAVAAAA
ncbi:chemotaxis protein CheW [Phenylobacterium sp.]|uniref:chemotaxis protein CheW n=1 Tax=Phenylobacterium sp. TaxID=1871053 RepID=UPI00286AB801|nr:chemotaxis protein CheW [Phenylobacterium sp.]